MRRHERPRGQRRPLSPANFEELIAPVTSDAFFSQTWETAPLHIRRSNPGYYETMLTLADVEVVLSSGGLRFPAIQMARNGSFFPADSFCRNLKSGDDTFSGVPDMARVQAEYQAGATISLPGFHRAWGPLSNLAASVESHFDHAVHTNVYITPGAAAGFSPHYDTHDVFIMQISGAKHWTIHDAPLELPHRQQSFDPRRFALSPPRMEVELQPGDLLYMPRGFVHATRTSEAASVHVTLGITVYTWVELLAEWLQSAKNDMRFRRALPPGFVHRPELRQSLKDGLADRVAEFHHGLDSSHIVDTFLHKVEAGLGGTGEAFRSGVVAIGPGSQVRAPDQRDYRLEAGGDAIALIFAGKTLLLPNHVRPALDEMGRRRSFSCRELTCDMTQDAALALIRHLHKEGFLKPVS